MKQLLTTFVLWLCCTLGAQSQIFTSTAIPDSVWQTMQGKTWHDNPYIKRSDLRYLRISHVDLEGRTHVGEMICNKLIADKLLTIFRELYKAHYPIQQMRLPDVYDADDERQMRANNTSCFCYRNISGSKNLSKHARGLAVDINTLYNPYVRYSKKDGSQIVEPVTICVTNYSQNTALAGAVHGKTKRITSTLSLLGVDALGVSIHHTEPIIQ